MRSFYQFLATGMGVILFAFFLAGILVIVRNLKKRLLPGQSKKAADILFGVLPEEKREHQRVSLLWPGAIETSNGPLQVKVKDISFSGAFIACNKPLPLKESFFLRIDLPGKEPLRLDSEVVWSNANVPEERIVTRGMGIRFRGITEQDRGILNEAITRFLQEEN